MSAASINPDSIDPAEIEDICRAFARAADGLAGGAISTTSSHPLVQNFTIAVNMAFDVARRAVRSANQAADDLKKIHRIARIGNWRVIVDGRYTTWSDEMHVLVGSDPQHTVPGFSAMIDHFVPADRYFFVEAFEAVAAGQPGATLESRIRTSGGQERWFWIDMQAEYDETGTIFAVRGICQDITERKSAFERIRHIARHDVLTGLANRLHLTEQLARTLSEAEQRRGTIAVLCFDLDGFKTVNDLFGHAAGDEVLRTVARRTARHVRETDIVARVGGDEFVVIQVGGRQPMAVQRLARRLLTELAEPIIVPPATEIAVSASIGVALYPQDGLTADDLLARADRALYVIKGEGRNGVALYDRTMEREFQERRTLEHDLRFALQHREFALVYQPMHCARNGEVKGFEALLRWHSPVHGTVPPDVFIGIAESIGLMGLLGAWVLRTACTEAAHWQNPLAIAVNVSPIQLQHGGLAETIHNTLADTGLAPERLEIEITESMLIRNPDRALETLRQIKALGVRVVMDDFGTGYSSLATLRAFPFDKLKVDRGFVRELGEETESLAIINAILGLGRGLRLPVVVEGVETELQATILRRCGADEIQGFLLGRPSPIGCFSAITDPDGIGALVAVPLGTPRAVGRKPAIVR